MLAGELARLQATSNMPSVPMPKIVWRRRNESNIGLRTVLADTQCRSQPDAVANKENGFYVVGPDESVIFLSESEDPNSKLLF
jgi:hypothetical protein